MSIPDAEIERIQAAADAAYDADPGMPLAPAQAEQIRRILPMPQADRQAA